MDAQHQDQRGEGNGCNQFPIIQQVDFKNTDFFPFTFEYMDELRNH